MANFIIAPFDVLRDHRLGAIDLRVLLALLSFRAKNTDMVWPSRSALMERSGYNAPNVSRAITRLVQFGWVERRQHRGPNTYRICVPELSTAQQETVSESETVSRSETVSESDTNSIQIGNETVSRSDTPEQTKKSKKKKTSTYMAHLPEPEKTEPVDNSQESSPKDRCPVAKIVALYHETLPSLPRVEKITPTRRGYIQQRWREDLRTLEQWGHYFDYVGQSDFLMGRTSPTNGRPPFRADLEWLCRPGNFTKVAEEKYHR